MCVSSCVVVKASIHHDNLSRQYVFVKSQCFDRVVVYTWGDAEALERDDRGAPPGGA
jgi:hypothetical protein